MINFLNFSTILIFIFLIQRFKTVRNLLNNRKIVKIAKIGEKPSKILIVQKYGYFW